MSWRLPSTAPLGFSPLSATFHREKRREAECGLNGRITLSARPPRRRGFSRSAELVARFAADLATKHRPTSPQKTRQEKRRSRSFRAAPSGGGEKRSGSVQIGIADLYGVKRSNTSNTARVSPAISSATAFLRINSLARSGEGGYPRAGGYSPR